MVWTVVVTAALVAGPAAPVKLAAPGLSGLNVNAEELAFYTEHIAQQLTLAGLQVTTAKQISSLLGLEKQKELMGCKDAASSCMAELASALGVDGVVIGSVGKLETSYRVNVSIVAASDGHTLAAYSARAGTSEEVVEALTTAAKQMAGEVVRTLRRQATAPAPELRVERSELAHAPNVRPEGPSAQGQGLRPYAWAPAAGAGVLAVAGTILAIQAGGRLSAVSKARDPSAVPASYEEVQAIAEVGKTYQLLAGIGYGAAGLGAAAAVLMYLSGEPQPGRAGALRVAPSNGGVALSWSWP